MRTSTERFLTTHTGSLPRPDDLVRMMYAKEEGVPVDARRARAHASRPRSAEVVGKQAQAGVDIVNDGEMSKPSYATYIKDRLTGFGGDRQHVRLPGSRRFSEAREARVRRSRPLAPQDAGVQRADRRARPAGRADRRRASAGGAGRDERRRTRSSPPRRPASYRCSSATSITATRRRTSPRSPRRCATSTRRSRTRASCCRSTAPISAWAATSSTRRCRSPSCARRPSCTSRR